ncbi:hypothetical protein DL98DRAFT_660217 [Cadophora sp. DSE1049]|nr:hypothetical protein DL98DRAFT_660217 [Cadophora sp. DSE1049]
MRSSGVPLDWDIDRLQSFLADQDDSTGPIVRSLAVEVDGLSHTATVTFRNVPRPLQIPQAGWDIPGRFLFLRFRDHKVDIVAIAGLGGLALGSFKEKGGEHMWLRDALPYDITLEDHNIARVRVYGYESSLP